MSQHLYARQALAAERGVAIHTTHADLTDWQPAPASGPPCVGRLLWDNATP